MQPAAASVATDQPDNALPSRDVLPNEGRACRPYMSCARPAAAPKHHPTSTGCTRAAPCGTTSRCAASQKEQAGHSRGPEPSTSKPGGPHQQQSPQCPALPPGSPPPGAGRPLGAGTAPPQPLQPQPPRCAPTSLHARPGQRLHPQHALCRAPLMRCHITASPPPWARNCATTASAADASALRPNFPAWKASSAPVAPCSTRRPPLPRLALPPLSRRSALCCSKVLTCPCLTVPRHCCLRTCSRSTAPTACCMLRAWTGARLCVRRAMP